MPRSTFTRFRLGVGIVAISTVLALTACAPESDPEPTSTAALATPAPDPSAGPAVFIGDELDWLLLTADELGAAFPGSTDISAPSPVLEQVSDGGGPEPVPAICSALFAEQSVGSVGSRNVTWTPAGAAEYSYGHLLVLQFADEAHAKNRMEQLMTAAEQCATFDYNGAASFDSVVPEASDHASSLAGIVTLPEIEGGRSSFTAYASVGNVLVQVQQSLDGDVPDAAAIATLLQDRAEQARATLIEELTANPPTTDEEPASAASAPWSDWKITAGGVGPIRLGDPIDVAVAAGQAAQTIEPEYEGGPWKLVDDAGTASLLISTAEGGSAAARITVGNDRTLDEPVQDGAALPLLGGIRVGDRVADAIAAWPGGTTVTVISSGDDWYDVATRDGRLFRFQADRDVADPAAIVVGITVEDATLRANPVFG